MITHRFSIACHSFFELIVRKISKLRNFVMDMLSRRCLKIFPAQVLLETNDAEDQNIHVRSRTNCPLRVTHFELIGAQLSKQKKKMHVEKFMIQIEMLQNFVMDMLSPLFSYVQTRTKGTRHSSRTL